ncbi:hypothetical protein G9C98_007697 [Cotesia typhae]|uniref:Gustatory receptor n=1 Tax=Cotesia typhae TaxID=2053667 RepID=A0A8J5UWC9_9HYME|nr:hypothetical protein G9C98_007697 [Cotesia typhae]
MIHPADKSGQLALVVAEIKQKGQPSEPAFDTWNLPKKSHRMTSLMRTIYLCYSFGFLLSRTTAVSLTAASVHDESLLPAPILYGVHASSYSTEVVRFLTQVTTDNIGLTGMKFFSITRSFVLTVAGTIVTYELVLVQFNSFQQTSPLNMTNVCEVK